MKNMLRVSVKIFLTLSLISLLGQLVHGGEIRKVVYNEGPTEDEGMPSSSMEYIPPREEWFRVRRVDSAREQRPKYLAHGSPDIVVLNSEGTHGVRTRFPDYPEDSNDRKIPVNVRNRGRAGFQKYQDERESDSSDSTSEEQLPSTRTRQGEQKSDSTTPEQRSRYQSIRRGNGQQNQQQRVEQQEDQFDDEEGEDTRFSDMDDSDSVQATPPRQQGSRQRTFAAKSARVSDNDVEIITDLDDDDLNLDPPPHEQVAKMARYIVRYSNWTSMATISTRSPLKGYPFANIFSVSDGPFNNSSGIPYMYLTPLDMSATDLKNDSRASLTMSLAQSDYCRQQQYDPEDPRCAHVILVGKVVRVSSPNEVRFARNSLYSKHPEMESWPKDHGWFFAKLDIKHIIVLDYFGGAKTVSLDDYLNQPA